MSLDCLHPAVRAWFSTQFQDPTPAQLEAWPSIQACRHTLIAAPTGSGKTLAAFLAAIDALIREGLVRGLDNLTHVVYVSPLKALSNDIQRNLEAPLLGIRETLVRGGMPDVPINSMVRTGDTPPGDRERMRRKPPHILVTTPESLYILLTSDSGRRMLATARTLIVDEIHALAGNKRGAHLALSLERLQALCDKPLTRIGLSATQRPVETVADFLVGDRDQPCTIIDSGHVRDRDLAIEATGSPLEAVMAGEAWSEIHDRLAELAAEHRTTLIFVNTRRLAERIARHLSERLGEEAVTSHHGSLAREHRLDAELRLKSGQLRALVATASLELGIDIGDIDLVCQIGSPHSINAFLQRVGRSGHGVAGTPKGRLFPITRDDLVESVALIEAVRRGDLDTLNVPRQPLDVLAQHIVAEISGEEWGEEALFDCLRRAWPYRDLPRAAFEAVLTMLAEGFTSRRGRRSAWLHRDIVNRRLRGRRGARLTALTNGGAIPDQFDYDVVLHPEGLLIGSLNEDFAFESLPGDIFQLGNTSYRILKVEQGKVHVQDAHGQPPNIPFWFGEAPGRSDELSVAVSRLRRDIEQSLEKSGLDATIDAAAAKFGARVAMQLVEYLAAAHAALGSLPTRETVVLERFFDEAGDQHLVVHAPFGSRLNRAWGLALRKRFCRRFNFELQAAALEDSIVLSLGSTHSFPLAEVSGYLKSASVRDLLIQAVLDAPLFATRWRWTTSIALAVRRMRNGKRVPPQFQRSDAEDLLAVVFPDQLACLENVKGAREIPDHPLVTQTLNDCVHEAMDVAGLERLLTRIEQGEVQVLARDLAGPSPLAQEILNARPYAFLDDAPAEERRTQLVNARRFMDVGEAAALGALDEGAIARVRTEAWPDYTNADELHDALLLLGFVTESEVDGGDGDAPSRQWMAALAGESRACVVDPLSGPTLWVANERLGLVLAVHPGAHLKPAMVPVESNTSDTMGREGALIELLRARLEGLGPVSASVLAAALGLAETDCEPALLALEAEGYAMRGHFSPGVQDTEWCERGLLARIHRYTVKRLRQEIQPVSQACFMRFLFRWHGITREAADLGSEGDGQLALAAIVEQLEGFEAPAAAWETEILPLRLRSYEPAWLDSLCAVGRVRWMRLSLPAVGRSSDRRGAGPIRSTPIALLGRRGLGPWRTWHATADAWPRLSSAAQRLLQALDGYGASFFDELGDASGLLRSQVEQALAELAALGLVSSDSFAGLRALLLPVDRRRGRSSRGGRRGTLQSVEEAGRWSRIRPPPAPTELGPSTLPGSPAYDATDYVARALLRRYGVVFRRVIERESGLPPWRNLLYLYRRMEARGEVRGGRFVEGFSGEQFALPEAVGLLRQIRRQKTGGDFVSISAADPLNTVGTITPGQRVPALAGNRILYRDGVPVATLVGGITELLQELDESQRWEAEKSLRRRQIINPTRTGSSILRPFDTSAIAATKPT